MVSVDGYGAYVPLYRIERSTIATQHGERGDSGETAVPSHDETIVTLATKAAENALAHSESEDRVSAVYVASMSDPFAERGIAPHVAAALDIRGNTAVADFQGSARAATNALLAARDACESDRGPVLVVATDILAAQIGSTGEQTAGAGAAALVLAAEGRTAAFTAEYQNTTGFVGRRARSDEQPVEGHPRFNRRRYVSEVSTLLNDIEGGIDRIALQAPESGWGRRALGSADTEADLESVFDDVGYVGAASALLDLVLVLERAERDERLVLVGSGPGGCDALVFRTDERITAVPELAVTGYLDSKEYVPYAKHLTYRRQARGEN